MPDRKPTARKKPRICFLKAATVATKPFIYLSAGVSNAEFTEALELAGESGVKFNGVLCGRATWKDGIPDLRQARRRSLPQMAPDRGREEHQQRERPPEGRDVMALDLRGRTRHGQRLGCRDVACYVSLESNCCPFCHPERSEGSGFLRATKPRFLVAFAPRNDK